MLNQIQQVHDGVSMCRSDLVDHMKGFCYLVPYEDLSANGPIQRVGLPPFGLGCPGPSGGRRNGRRVSGGLNRVMSARRRL